MDPTTEANTAEQGNTTDAPPRNNSTPESRFSWRRWIRPVVFVIYGLLVSAATPFAIIDFSRAEEEEKFKRTLALVGYFGMVISIPISLWGIVNHMIYFTRPSLQKYIIRILWMVPIYVLNSWFALRFPEAEIYFDTVRQLYKAFTVYNFVFYLVAFFEDEVPDFESRLAMKAEIDYPRPFCWKKGIPNKRMIHRCKLGVLSYTVIQIISTIVTIVTHLTGNYNEGDFSANDVYLWVTIILTGSQIWAMFCKNLLRRATVDELKLLPRYTLQFVAVQFVIFGTYFQSTTLNILAKTGVIKPNPAWGYEDKFAFATMLQDFLICLEMVACAALFTYSFDYQRYDTDEPKQSIAQIFKYMWTMSDVRSRVMERSITRGTTPEGYQSTDLVQSEQPQAVDEVHPSLQSDSPTEPRVV